MESIGHLNKIQEVRIVEVKPFKAIISGLEGFNTIFDKVFGSLMPAKNHLFKKPFITGEPVFFQVYCPHNHALCPSCAEKCQMKGQFVFAVADSVTGADAAPYDLITFEGGLFAVATVIDGDEESIGSVAGNIDKWLKTSGFTNDNDSGRLGMTTRINPTEEVRSVLGFNQEDMYIPIKKVELKLEAAITLTSYNEGGQIIDADYAKIKAAPEKSVMRIFVENAHPAGQDRSGWGCGRIGNSGNTSDGIEFKGAPAGEIREYSIPAAFIKGPYTNVYNNCIINKVELWTPR
ncbi:MAG: hypothetical protein FWD40_05190 [Treponema sp.]|nr:hypothetical protein [Treponema sp.]